VLPVTAILFPANLFETDTFPLLLTPGRIALKGNPRSVGPLQHREFVVGGYGFKTMGLLFAPQRSRSLYGRSAAAILVFTLAWPILAAAGSSVGAEVIAVEASLGQPDLCATGLVDTSGEIDTQAVDAAIAEFEQVSPGTAVYARVYDDNTDLDAARQQILGQCGTSEDYIFVAIDVPSQESSVSGSAFGDQLAEDIRTGAMRESLRSGDLSGGLTGAFRDASIVVEGLGNEVIIDREAPEPESESNNLGSYILAGSVIGLAGVGGGVIVRNRRKQLAERRQTFATRIAEPRIRMGAARERDARLSHQGERFGRTVEGRTLDQLRHMQHEVGTAGNDAERQATLLGKATPDGIQTATNDELMLGETRLSEFTEALGRYQAALDKLTAFGELLDRLRVALPTKRALLIDELDDADALGSERTKAGWKIDAARERLVTLRTTIIGVTFDELRLDLLEMSDRLEGAEAELFSARYEVEAVVDRPKGIADWAKELEIAEYAQRSRVDKTSVRLASVVVPHSPDSWRWVSDHTDEAAARLDRSVAHRASGLSLVPSQDWAGAGAELETAGLELNAADALLDELDTLMIDLEQARAESPGMMRAAVQELEELKSFVAAKATDLAPEYHLNPQKVQAVLEEMGRELTARRPNYLRVAQTLDRVDRQMDLMLIESQEEAQRIAALRRELVREISRAKRAIKRAHETLGWTIFSTRKTKLEDLEADLNRLNGSWEQQIDQAAAIADSAVAIREAIIHDRRRRNTGLIIVGGSGAHRGGGGWSSSGGGGGFGGGGGGGGFGGGGFGGGGGSFGGGSSTGGW
jgi:hypothetical protein